MSSPSTATLRGVCFVPPFGSWLAVGDDGTILSSGNFTSWETVPSGTRSALRGIAYGTDPNRVVIVGADGTILTRETNSSLWVPRASGTRARLNAVTFGGGVFVAVGDGGTVLTSPDGLTWRSSESGTTEMLTSVAHGEDRFAVAAEHPTVLVSTDGAASFQRHTLGGAASREGTNTVTFASSRFHVSGNNGIFTSSDGSSWHAIAPPAAPGEALHGAAFFDGALLTIGNAGLIRDELGIARNGGAPAADWRAAASRHSTVFVVGAGGQAAFHEGPLVTEPRTTVADPSGGAVAAVLDPTFTPALNAEPDAVLPLPDGRLLVTGVNLAFHVAGRTQHGIARLNRDGSVDPAFDLGAGFSRERLRPLLLADQNLAGGTFSKIVPVAQSDGKLVVFAGLFFGLRSGAFKYLAVGRFNSDGSLDPSFQPAPGLREPANLPMLLADGRWLVATPSADGEGKRTVRLERFSADGLADASFGEVVVSTGFDATASQPGLSTADRWNQITLRTVDAQNRIYLVTTYELPPWAPSLRIFRWGLTGPKTLLLRLLPDGSPDPSFPVRALGELSFLSATNAGLIVLETFWDQPTFVGLRTGITTLRRLRLDGVADPTFRASSFTHPMPVPATAATTGDGSVHVLSRVLRGHRGIVRFEANGIYDSDFAAELGAVAARVTQVVPLPSGQFLIAGDFTAPSASYLARIDPVRNASATRLVNLSARARAGRGAEALIAGWIVRDGSQNVLVRGAGPVLATFSVVEPLADPEIALYSGERLIDGNDDWSDGPAAVLAATAARVNAFPFPHGSRDAALLTRAASGTHTVHLASKTSASGIALVELYEAELTSPMRQPARFANFSARAHAGTGENVLAAGFILRGNHSRNILLRAVGPSLARFGVPGVLTNPVLTLFRGPTAVARNDNWEESSAEDAALCQQAADSVGAFPLERGGMDAQLLVTLAPGAYTVQVTGGNTLTGTALLEVYEVP